MQTQFIQLGLDLAHAACTQDEVNEIFESSKAAQKTWARTPLYKRAEALHKVAELMRQNAQPIADCLVKEIAKPKKDSYTEVIRCVQPHVLTMLMPMHGELLQHACEHGTCMVLLCC